MAETFKPMRVVTEGAEINLVTGGAGPPLLLLHGYPQTHFMWHKIMPRLAAHFTVVASDLRGYGDSAKPPGGDDHAGYSKRAMALDQVQLMNHLGFDSFYVAGHDRGGRVGHRMALDHAPAVKRLAVLDIVPTHKLFATTDAAFATAYYHWFFLIQPYDIPETLIGADAAYYLNQLLGRWAVKEVPPDYRRVGEALLEEAKALGADMLAMGGYSNSRLRERILGGVSIDILGHAELPVLIVQ